MADDSKACNLMDETKKINNTMAKNPTGQDNKKLSPEVSKDKKPKSSPIGKSVEEEENQGIIMKSDNISETEEGASQSNTPSDTKIEFNKGLRVEVKDLPTDTWYLAKVVDIEGSDVLIHYVNWAARHDEWITMDSNRIRAHSGEVHSPPVVVAPVISRKRGRPVGSGMKNKSAAASTTPKSSTNAASSSTEPTDVEIKDDGVVFEAGEDVKAIWTDSRKYPAKIVEVLENGTCKVAFSDGFEKIMSKSKISKLKPGETVASVPPPTTQELVIDDPDSKEGRRQRKRKINVVELFRRKPSTSKTPQVESPVAVPAKKPKLEEPDEKVMSPEPTIPRRGRGRPPRKTLEPVGSPTTPMGTPLSVEIKEEPLDDIKMDAESEINTPAISDESSKEPDKTILPSISTKAPAPAVAPPVPAVEIPVDIPEEPIELFIGNLKIEREGDNLKCPKEGCGKLLRKEKLIMMHIKHYHPELKKEMDVVPQVLDYAYARYIGDLPSTASMIRNFTNPPSGGNSNSTPKKKAVKSPVKQTPEPIKVEDQPPVAVTASLTPRIQLGKSSNSKSSASKIGLKVKTLLPVKKSLPQKPTEPKEKLEPKKSLEMPVLKKALMTPPMNSSIPAHQRLNETIKEEKQKLPILTLPKKSPRKSPRKDHLVEDGAMELINCVCGYTEEDGLIIQCDLCFCWQHGSCNLIDREEDVPDKFVCHVCRSPVKERKSRKYAHDQDWLKKGTLPRLPVLRLNEKFERSSLEKALKETQDIASATLTLGEIMHSLKTQINIAQKKDHPKLYLWSKEWDENEKIETKDAVPLVNNYAESTPQKMEVDMAVLPTSFDPIPGTSTCGQANVDDVDLHPALKMPLSALEIEHLATTMAQSIPAAEPSVEAPPHSVILHPPKAPEPEAAIKPEKCRVLLLKHIQHMQDQLEARINELESRNLTLEKRAPQIYGKEVPDSRIKETLRMLQRDVGSVHKIGKYAKKN